VLRAVYRYDALLAQSRRLAARAHALVRNQQTGTLA